MSACQLDPQGRGEVWGGAELVNFLFSMKSSKVPGGKRAKGEEGKIKTGKSYECIRTGTRETKGACVCSEQEERTVEREAMLMRSHIS